MKTILFALPAFLCLVACTTPPPDNSKQLQLQIDSLQKQLERVYKPGLGEFMSSIQVHHAKLYFAGESKNWPLADFEIHEIMESLEDIPKYCADREEIKSIGMLQPAIDSMNAAIAQKNYGSFKSSFFFLTGTCNNCHAATNHAFNVIKIPDAPPFSNQDFKVNAPK